MIHKVLKKLPNTITKYYVHLPLKYRYGQVYSEFSKKLSTYNQWTDKKKESYIVAHFNTIFQHAKKFNFYRLKYEKEGVLDLTIRSLEDIQKVPLLTKEEIRNVSKEFKGYYSQNTGGTTGTPISFQLDKGVWLREWSHMHYIWRQAGYKQEKAKFTFRGINLGDKNIVYNYEQNEFLVNTYVHPENFIRSFLNILNTKNVKYFHGYPSAVYNFLKEIEPLITDGEKQQIKDNIECCFLGSEYPNPVITAYLKDDWHLDYISWYGHSEVCVLAHTKINDTKYVPLNTYGYVEEENNKLIGTSYHNFDMPLIRYYTGDTIVSEKTPNGLVKYFTISNGREGDFIIDANNKKITLTALIFGRHHKIFGKVDFIQIFQEEKGKATIIVSNSKGSDIKGAELMDLKNVNINFDFIYLKSPIKSISGKVPLKILKKSDLKNIK